MRGDVLDVVLDGGTRPCALNEDGAEGNGDGEEEDDEEAGEIEADYEEVRVTADVDARVRLPRKV